MDPFSTVDCVGHTTLGGRERVLVALGGFLPAVIAVYLIISPWAPRWFLIAWLAVYSAHTVTMSVLTLVRPSPALETVWSFGVGICISSLPLAAVRWTEEPAQWWTVVIICLVSIMFEFTGKPFMNIVEWRLGVIIVGSVLAFATVLYGEVLLAACFVGIFTIMLRNAHRLVTLRHNLEAEWRTAVTETGLAREQANHDELTGLLNRRGLAQEMDKLEGSPTSCLVIDANRFKLINDTHGYSAGDQVLVQIAEALKDRLPAPWVLGRQGGDEFVAIAPGRPAAAPGLVAPVSCAFEHHGTLVELSVGISGGLASDMENDDSDRLLSQAAYALRAAKREGGGLERFSGGLERRYLRTIEVAEAGQDHLDIENFFAEAQPIVDAGERIVGIEMLARWRRSDGSIMAPAEFLPLVAENGLMPVLDDAMIERAIAFAGEFNNLPHAPFVSVNVAVAHLCSHGFVERITGLLAEHRVVPTRLMIELAEAENLDNVGDWETAARQLAAAGVKLAIDDFGAAYSSIERLNSLPISHIKFDRALVQSVTGPVGEIVRGLVRFATASRLGVIAEGIETVDELDSMRSTGVTLFQGWYFGAPMPLDTAARQIMLAPNVVAS